MFKEQSKALFYTQGKDETLDELQSSREGLSTAEAQKRLDEYGHNELEESQKRSLLAKFLDQFKDLMIIILLVAAALFGSYRGKRRANRCAYYFGSCYS